MLSSESDRTNARTRHRPGLPDVQDLPAVGAAENVPRAVRPAHAAVSDPGSPAADDWDDMHDAVAERLQAILQSTAPGPGEAEPRALAARTYAMALECAAALNQLQAAMALDRADLRRMERELGGARSALARARLDFADSQAGELHARHLAFHDDLTALPNRRHCRERLDEALALAAQHQTTAALLYLDLDGFKAINDRHGHETGDEVLRIVAARLSRVVRAGDVVCRLGGDEFVCLPSGPLSGPQLAHLAGKLFDAVSAPLSLDNLRLDVRPSIGVAIFPVDADNTEGLLKAADAAMYRAKLRHIGFAFAGPAVEVDLPP
ncbi:MAG TPA: GGDEF domain-containing protein [Ideonella sp.]|uniref:GGDEF domain-containing protein n=1 Tax=Ideonella sp. TaxID=1929293 RepID=UPI002E353E8A|nr:GGDEF domain-containing protein [Ideonella sp.]HEX5685892.1 GGDEF domain-containing protein [Ideonella sp.]